MIQSGSFRVKLFFLRNKITGYSFLTWIPGLILAFGGRADVRYVIPMGYVFLSIPIIVFFLIGKYGAKSEDIIGIFRSIDKIVLAESEKALSLSGVDLVRPSETIWGDAPEGWNGGKKAYVRNGLCSLRTYTVFHYANDQLLSYGQKKDIYRGLSLASPRSSEFFYEDVVSIEAQGNLLRLTTRGGNALNAPFANQDMAEAAIANVRSLLRERKQR